VATVRSGDGWSGGDPADRHALSAFLDRSRSADAPYEEVLQAPSGRALALATPLPSIDGARATLVLRYRLSDVMSPYRALFGTLFIIGVGGLALLVIGSWFLASSITRPLSKLEAAARRLQEGVFEDVAVATGDELARLADSFNAMAASIRERERRITHLAYHDAETQLPNRLALERRLAGAANAERLYLASVGVDRFAHVRGAIGYALAGALVRTLGQRLSRLVPNALAARLSSDVLGVAFLANDDADARKRAGELITALEQPLSLQGHDLDVHVSVGVAQPLTAGERPAAMIERASIALDQARAARHKVGLFDEAAYGDPARNLSLMSEMLRALESGEMLLAHQPKFDFRSGCIESAETLLRWRHPMRGMISPDLFVPMAEETGHVRALTEWVLERAIADQTRLMEAGWPLTLSLNISGRLLSDNDFTSAAVAMLRRAPHQMCFEITETAVIDNPEAALDNIELFAANGARIAIDDYGSGLSSLSYLKQLPAHELKIDKMFVESITSSQRDALLVRSTIDLAHGLGLDVVAEGVETPAAFAALAAMKCDLAQGFLVGRPLPAQELAALLADERRLRFYRQTAASVPQIVPKTA
jgi:EAL domain-containing protein (putative c-di-GMP-specific phosphodiesterase class I)/HAMP domain-containing protein